jgi:hypothetical protein
LFTEQYAWNPSSVYVWPRLSVRDMAAPRLSQPARCASVSTRQAAELAAMRARTVPCAVELGLTGIARVRRYWPKRFRELVTPATLPDWGTSSIFMRVQYGTGIAAVKNFVSKSYAN